MSDGTKSAAAPSMESLMKRGHLFLEDSEWKQANEYFDRALDIDPEYAPAYVGKLCAELYFKKEMDLVDHYELLDNIPNYQKALRFADADYRAKLAVYSQNNSERILQELIQSKVKASTEKKYQELAKKFREMNGYQNSTELASECDNQYRILKERREEQERQVAEKGRQARERYKEHDRKHREKQHHTKPDQSDRWAEQGLCRHCGGQMTGWFTKKCQSCGKVKE